MANASPTVIHPQTLTPQAYSLYGDVIAADESMKFSSANFGRAKRFNYLGDLVNLRPDSARPNICVFRCSPFSGRQLEISVLEKHPYSTQVFLPMHDGRFITIVATGGDAPDLNTLAAFVIDGPQGITYRPGIWHYPMTALGAQLDMACLVFEDETKGDCAIFELPAKVVVALEGK